MATMEWIHEHFRRSSSPESARRALERYRMGQKAGGSIRGVRVFAGPDSCPSCRALTGAVYSLDEAPALPNPACTNPAGCRCAYRPVMAYETRIPEASGRE